MPNKDVPKVFKTDSEAPASEKNTSSVLRVAAVIGVFLLAVAALGWLI